MILLRLQTSHVVIKPQHIIPACIWSREIDCHKTVMN